MNNVRRRIRRGFTLVEILIVVMILGILASIIVPHYVGASDESRHAAIVDQLRMMRDQVNIYRAEHREQFPGTTAAVPGGTIAMFVGQFTQYTDADGDVAAAKDATHKFGPYLPSIPLNPMSGTDTIKYDWSYDAIPTPDDSTGWIYQPFTGRLSLNKTGNDKDGTAYVAY